MNDLTIGNTTYAVAAAPYNNKTGVDYRKYHVIGLEAITNIRTYDPYAVHFKPLGVSLEDYQELVSNNTILVHLKDCAGNTFSIPDHVLTVADEDSMVDYVNKTLVVSIGLVPDDIDLTSLKTNMSDLIKSSIGVVPSIGVLNTSIVIPVESDVDIATTASRAATMAEIPLDSTGVLYGQYKETLAKLIALEAALLNCNGCTDGVAEDPTKAPVITMNGLSVTPLKRGDVYTDSGAVAWDTVDKTITEDIIISGSVDTLICGVHNITYKVTNSNGLTSEAIRVVIVSL